MQTPRGVLVVEGVVMCRVWGIIFLSLCSPPFPLYQFTPADQLQARLKALKEAARHAELCEGWSDKRIATERFIIVEGPVPSRVTPHV